jgi:hypothetical protein
MLTHNAEGLVSDFGVVQPQLRELCAMSANDAYGFVGDLFGPL